MNKLTYLMAIAVSAIIYSACSTNPDGTNLVEEIKKKDGELVIPYKKFEMANGLTLIVHEDHSDPIVHVDVTYHVGSSREEIGKSGFAHFFEHMMFQGSDHVGDEEHFKFVTEAGGTLNGTTNSDRTNYFETLPSNQLELGLWLESDRMGYFLDAVTQKKFEIQRATVKNERGQNYDNRAYGLVNEKIGQALYPYGHPYSWPTIGYLEDLDRADVEDLKKFFLRWYGPNNAVLTVAGDVKTDEVVELAEKYFGTIPSGPEVKPLEKTPVTLPEDRYISYEDNNVNSAMLQMVFPTVPHGHPDEAPLDVLSEIYGGNNNSIFYKNFVETKIAANARVGHPCSELSGEMQMYVIPDDKYSLVEMEQKMRESIAEFEKRGVTQDDIDRYKASYESSLIRSLESVSGKAATLARYETFFSDANHIGKDRERYLGVTKEDVQRVYEKYIKGKPAVILSVYPKGKSELLAAPDNFKYEYKPEEAAGSPEYENLVYNKPEQGFDRSVKPKPGPSPVVKVPEYWQEELANGLKVVGTRNDEVPSVALRFSIRAGHRYEPAEKSGMAELTAAMLNESTLNFSTQEVNQELDKIGSRVEVSSDAEEITVSVYSLTKHLDKTLAFVEEVMFRPKFDKEEFEKVKYRLLDNVADRKTSPRELATDIFKKTLYGREHIMSVPANGTILTVNNVRLDDVKAYYEKMFNPAITSLVIVGDVEKDQVLSSLGFIKDWESKGLPEQRNYDEGLKSIDTTKIYFVNKERAPQSEIRIGYLAMPYDATGEAYRATLMNYVLGGAFNSRINLNLREDKGWTYGARSRFHGTRYKGPFMAYAGVKATATDSAVVEFLKEMKNYRASGITNDELDFLKRSVSQSEARRYETPLQKASFLQRLIDYNLDGSFTTEQNNILQNITTEEINELAKKHLPIEKMAIIVVGDRATVYEGLSKLNYEIIELDVEGNPVIHKKKSIEG